MLKTPNFFLQCMIKLFTLKELKVYSFLNYNIFFSTLKRCIHIINIEISRDYHNFKRQSMQDQLEAMKV